MLGYGLINQDHLSEYAQSVCNCLGYGANGTAPKLIIETAYAETNAGMTRDNTLFAGMGLTQFDKIPFYDIRDRTRQKDKYKIKEHFDIDIDLVEWEHLRYNPLLCLIFTRLKYKKVTAAIPKTLEGRAKYWKEHYNTYHPNAKGTIEHYMESNK